MSLFNEITINIFVSLLGAATLWVVTKLIQKVNNSRINKRFPISGRYMSTFEDVIDGVKVKTKAIAYFRQRGYHIYGETRELKSDRVWELDGRLNDNGKMSGTYEAKDPHDVGIGSFYLEFTGDGSLEGIWSGFDSVNKLPMAGKYTFRRMPKISLVPLTSENLGPALSCIGNALGDKYVSVEELSEYSSEGDDKDKFAFVALINNTVVGAITGDFFRSGKDLLDLVPADKRTDIEIHLPHLKYNKVLLIHSVAVDPAQTGKGIGTALVRQLIRHGLSLGATTAVAIGWTDSAGCHIEGTLKALCFKDVVELPNYWFEDSKLKDYACATCGQPCKCSAKVFVSESESKLEVAVRDYI